MELDDCAFPLLKGSKDAPDSFAAVRFVESYAVVQTSDLNEGFDDIDYALLVGSRPRGKGMERKDLLAINGKIFVGTGEALNKNAKKTAKVLVVGTQLRPLLHSSMDSHVRWYREPGQHELSGCS